MTWDDDKDTFQSRPDVPDDEKITSAEWNAHTDDQKDHSDRHESGGSDELSVAGLSGVLADAQDPQTEAVQDIVGGLLAGGTNITTTYDDGNDILTVDTSALDQEEVEDAVAALVTAGNAITVNYDDPNDTLSVGVNESALSFYDGTNLTADVDNTSVTTDSLSTESLSDGIAGVGNSIGDVIGDTDEFIKASNTPILPGESTSVSSTTFTSLGGSSDFIQRSKPLEVTNATAYVSVAGRVSSLDQDVTLRYRSNTGTEITVSSTGGFVGPWAEPQTSAAMIEGRLENQTNGDTATLNRLNVVFAYKIGQ